MTETFDLSTMARREIVVEHEFDAPRELVWAAFTEPEQLARWWGPEHFTTPLDGIEVDLRPGGVYAMTMVDPDGNRYPNRGTFDEVVHLERLVFSEPEVDHPIIEDAKTTIVFSDLGDGRTKVLVTQDMVTIDEMPEMAKAGWGSSFVKLERVLAA